MKNKTVDINDLVTYLTGTAMQPLLKNEIWQSYGYRKRPKKGAIWNKIFPNKFQLENFIATEILTMGLIDTLNGVKKSTKSHDTKLLISLGVVDQFLSTTEHMFNTSSFMENLFSSYASFLKQNKSKLHEPIILKAKEILDKKDFAKFMVGTIKLLAMTPYDGDYLIKSNYIMNLINKSTVKNKLKISMSDEMYKKYEPLLSKKILNA